MVLPSSSQGAQNTPDTFTNEIITIIKPDNLITKNDKNAVAKNNLNNIT